MPKGLVRTRRIEDLPDTEAHKRYRIEVAETAVGAAKVIAPVGTKTHRLKSGYVSKKGDYRRGIKVKVLRGKVYVSATDFKSHWIEWGSVNNFPPSATLRRSARIVGLRLHELDR